MSLGRILVVEDEPDLLTCVRHSLQQRGYLVTTACDGQSGIGALRREEHDLALLDRLLPDLDGLELCRMVKSDARLRATRVLIMSALDQESEVVLGLGLGADDYLRKPFGLAELAARVAAALRRPPSTATAGEEENERVTVGDLVVDLAHYSASVAGRSVALTPTELRLLHALALRPGRVFTRSQLLDRALGDHADVVDRNIDVHIQAIRAKLASERDLIETVRGVGYRLRGNLGS